MFAEVVQKRVPAVSHSVLLEVREREGESVVDTDDGISLEPGDGRAFYLGIQGRFE